MPGRVDRSEAASNGASTVEVQILLLLRFPTHRHRKKPQ